MVCIQFNKSKYHCNKLHIGIITIKSASSVTVLGITLDSKLNFQEHISNIVKKHIINYMPSEDCESF